MGYVLLVAPAILAQLSPFASQRHQTKRVDVGFPLQVPSLAVSVEPTAGLPEIVGAAVFVGAAALEITAEGAEVAWLDPPAFVAVTVTRRRPPTSVDAAL
jgi:hypothetical protein